MKSRLDRDIERLISENGIRDVIAALARRCHAMGMPTLYRRLVKLHEWLTS